MFATQDLTVLERVGEVLYAVFGGDVPEEPVPFHQAAARAVVVFLVGVLVIRMGKSRVISRATSLDVLVGFILGSLLSRAITGHASLSATAASSAALVAAHWLFTLAAYRWHALGNLLKGQPRLLVEDGRPIAENMRASHISPHDLEEMLRLHGVEDLSQVRRATKERNGEISVIKRG